jgi:beta-glucosidase
MVPYKDAFLEDALEAVEKGYIPESRIDVAVDRVLKLKHRVGLLGNARGRTNGSSAASGGKRGRDGAAAANGRAAHGGDASRETEDAQSLAAAEAGVVLLKNRGGALPLRAGRGEGSGPEGAGVVAVVGPSAQSAANLVGGWSVHWQGPDSEAEVLPPFTHRSIAH